MHTLFLIQSVWKNFWSQLSRYILLMLPLILPVFLLRFVSQYAYLGKLFIVYSTIVGIALTLVALIVEITVIHFFHDTLQKNQPQPTYSIINSWNMALTKFPRYLGLKFVVFVIILALPVVVRSISLLFIGNLLVTYIVNIIIITWIVSVTLIFVFAPYYMVIHGTSIMQSLKKSAVLFMQHAAAVIGTIFFGFLIFGGLCVLMALSTNIVLAVISQQTTLLLNAYLSPWWQFLVIDIWALLGLPLLIGTITALYRDLSQEPTV